ncbi:MAG: hexulose-6-phosphate synthase [Proteobacteria bacterium]|nr:hexulose-6-phosphate synthase [Pseudomonadota bacterium]
MNNKQKQTLDKIFERPTRADVRWPEIESFFKALGINHVKLKGKTRGSRACFEKDGCRAVFHKPHPGTIVCKGCVEAVRDYLQCLGIRP